MDDLTAQLEAFDPIRLIRNPSREQYERVLRQSDGEMVRALVGMDRQWYIWPGQLSEHLGVIMQTGLREVIPIRLTGNLDGTVFVEVTDTRADLPTAELDDEWLASAMQRFVARQKFFRHVRVDVWPID